MGLETFTFITSLVATNPTGADLYSTADDHFRGMKTALLNSFPNVSAAATATPTEFNRLVGITSALEQVGNKNIASGYAGLNSSSQLANAQVSAANITQHQASLAIAFTQLTGSIANAQVPVGAVTQHQTSLALAASQTTSGTFADARIAASNVTQHQGALALAASQITSGTFLDARIASGNVTQHQAALVLTAVQITSGTFANAQISSGNVTQHQTALAVNDDQVTADVITENASFSVSATHRNAFVDASSASAIVITVGSDALGNGRCAIVKRGGAGTVTFAVSGVTINSKTGLLAIAPQHGHAALFQKTTTVFELSGDLG